MRQFQSVFLAPFVVTFEASFEATFVCYFLMFSTFNPLGLMSSDQISSSYFSIQYYSLMTSMYMLYLPLPHYSEVKRTRNKTHGNCRTNTEHVVAKDSII